LKNRLRETLNGFFVYFIAKIYQSLRFNCLQVKATTDKLTQSGEKWNFVENSAKFFQK
jgi:hypothetical protein